MNCKPGEMAFVTGRAPENVGRVVTCLRRVEHGESIQGLIYQSDRDPPAWWVSGNLFWLGVPCKVRALKDAWLKPIRPTDGEDETLSWKSVPKTFTVTTDEEAERIVSEIPTAHVRVVQRGVVLSEFWGVRA